MEGNIFAQVRRASKDLLSLEDSVSRAVLEDLAQLVESRMDVLLKANEVDLSRMSKDNPKYDRLMLTPSRLAGIADGLRQVASLPSPLGRVLSGTVRPNGLAISRVSVPFGVIGIIYEARPNVTFDVFGLCFRSGNACVLKGGRDADETNRAGIALIHEALERHGVNTRVAELLPSTHDAAAALMHARGFVDLIIPRGGSTLIKSVRDNSTVPVIETGAGVCHCYFDASGDVSMGAALVCNAKTRRVSVCNALDCLIVHRSRLGDLPALCAGLAQKNVTIYADEQAYNALSLGPSSASASAQADSASAATTMQDVPSTASAPIAPDLSQDTSAPAAAAVSPAQSCPSVSAAASIQILTPTAPASFSAPATSSLGLTSAAPIADSITDSALATPNHDTSQAVPFAASASAYPPHLLKHAVEDSFGTEFLDYKMAVKTVSSLGEALEHIAAYGSGHSESIVTADKSAAERFCREVDAACVYVNSPTSFSDGGEFGLGAEIGISTQKLHARGPMALEELTTYKWLIHGDGQTRP